MSYSTSIAFCLFSFLFLLREVYVHVPDNRSTYRPSKRTSRRLVAADAAHFRGSAGRTLEVREISRARKPATTLEQRRGPRERCLRLFLGDNALPWLLCLELDASSSVSLNLLGLHILPGFHRHFPLSSENRNGGRLQCFTNRN